MRKRIQGPGWAVARLEDIPVLGPASDPDYWKPWARDADYGRRWNSVGRHFGITSFGVNAYSADAGQELVVPHTETEFGGQEELYLVVRGRARFLCDGEEVEAGEGELVHVRADVERAATALETPTLVFMVGGIPGAPYQHWTGSV